MGEAKTKGVGFVNVRAFVHDRFGEHGWSAVLSHLPPEDRAEVEHVLAVGWYSLPLYARLIRAVDEVHGAGDYALIVQLGRFEAERDVGYIQRILLRVANPAFTVEKVGEYWRRFHDSGVWSVRRIDEGAIEATLVDWGCVDHALCRELNGYIGRLLELVGASHVIMEHARCRGRGDATCDFRARWGSQVAPERDVDSTGERRRLTSPQAVSEAVKARVS